MMEKTDVNIVDGKAIIERLSAFVECLDKEIESELEKLPISNDDAIRKSAHCYALQKVKYSIENIIQGRDFNDMGD